jgi:hypothetical protein
VMLSRWSLFVGQEGGRRGGGGGGGAETRREIRRDANLERDATAYTNPARAVKVHLSKSPFEPNLSCERTILDVGATAPKAQERCLK